jgi:hypothetical protein
MLCSIIGLVTPDMLNAITWGTYIFFAAFALIALGFTYFLVPETRGKVWLLHNIPSQNSPH